MNNNGGNRNLSVEQAAKNLKLIGGGDDVMQAPTRNSNLISHPNKDKMAKNKVKDSTEEEAARVANLNLKNKKDLIQQQKNEDAKKFDVTN